MPYDPPIYRGVPVPGWNYTTGKHEVDATIKGSNVTSSLTIANGQQVATGYVDLGGSPLIALALPDQYAGGNITIQAAKDKAAADAGTFYDVYDSDGIAVTVTINGTITGGRVVSLISSALQAVSSLQFIRIKSAQAVGANRVIGIIAKG